MREYTNKKLDNLKNMFIKRVSFYYERGDVMHFQINSYQPGIFYLILQVIIEGFKSYREKTVLESFHPNLNVIGKDHAIFA